jgi:uncharacterized membrane protein YvbJ
MSPEVCPNCGALVPRKAKCCPECGADEETGWSESAQAANLGIPDDQFDYDEFVKEEFGHRPKPGGIHWVWWITALILLLIFLLFFLR